MTIKLDIICDKCGFQSENRFDFGNRHFSRIVMDGSDRTEYFHLCSKCQDEINSQIIDNLPKITLKTGAICQYEGVTLGGRDSAGGLNVCLGVHKGIIV